MKHAFIDKYSSLKSPVHSLDPRIKSLIIFSFVVVVVLTPVACLLKFAAYSLFLLVIIAISRVPLLHILKRIATVLPFVFVIVMFIPFIKEGEAAGSWSLGPVKVRVTCEGLWVMLNVLIKAPLAVAALALLVGTTRFSDLLKGFEKMAVPASMISILSFMYRFVFVLTDDAQRMGRAYMLRNFGGFRLRKLRTIGNMIGLLFIRTYERGERIYCAMVLRGYDGSIKTMNELRLRWRDIAALVIAAGCIAAIRIGRF